MASGMNVQTSHREMQGIGGSCGKQIVKHAPFDGLENE
jgi:hypothetical protein